MAREWFVRVDGREIGPLSSAQLKQLAATGKIGPDSELRLDGGKWSRAARVDGLFPVPMGIALPAEVPTPKPVAVIDSSAEERKRCPFCGESIALEAVKCRHCNEFLDKRHVATAPAAPLQVVQQVVVNNQMARPRFNRFVAALLSLLVPGLGQIYKGQPINGIVWFGVTLVGYVMFVVPGLLLHFLCVVGAASGDRFR